MDYININGKIALRNNSSLPVDNGAFRYGYGLFETLLVRNNTISLGEYHFDRLFQGMKTLMLQQPILWTRETLTSHILDTVKKNKLTSVCRVRLEVYAGGGGIFSPESAKPGFLIECFELPENFDALNENGLVVGIAEGLQKSTDSLSNLKTCNALVYALAAQQARHNKWNDALVCNTNGNIIESTIANLFWVKNGNIYTPPLTEGCIAGVMRRHIIASVGTITEQPLTPETLLEADELLLTNAIKKIKWIGNCGNRKLTHSMAGWLCGVV